MKGFITLILIMMGCGDPLPPLCEDPSPITQKIVDGTASTDRRSTVLVGVEDGWCTGTIIGPHTVLTAAHCSPAVEISVEGVGWFDVDAAIIHPDYSFPQHDLQILSFDTVLPGPYATIGLDPDEQCYSLLAQGYGIGGGGALHEREVFQLYRGYGIVEATEGICNGDSGGPLYGLTPSGPTLVAVSSFGINEPDVCLGGSTGFVDLTDDSNAVWVSTFL